MTASASKRAALLPLLALVLAAPALAQPRTILPGSQPSQPAPAPVPQAAPTQTAPGPSTLGTTRTPQPAKTIGSDSVTVKSLGAPDMSSIGALYSDSGGLGVEMWQGSDRATAEALLQALPGATRATSLRLLERKLLLSAAQAPGNLMTGAGQSANDLLNIRLAKLSQMGDSAGVVALAKAAGPAAGGAAVDRASADAALLAGDNKAACEKVSSHVGDDLYWLKLQLFCQAVAGETAAASVTLSLLRDQGVDDQTYLAIAAVLTGEQRGKLEKLGALDPVSFAMLKATKRPIPPEVATTAGPAVLAAIATAEGTPSDQRLAAAEAAEAFGALPTDNLVELYPAENFTEAEKAIQTTVTPKKNARAAALLYQLSVNQGSPSLRAEYLKRGLELGRDRGLFATASRANLAPLKALAPSSELAGQSGLLIRGLLAAGDIEDARKWAGALGGWRSDKAAAETLTQAWPLLLLAGAVEYEDRAFEAWLATQDAKLRGRRGTLVLGLAQGLGIQVPAARWNAVLGQDAAADETVAGPSALLRLPAAADGKRKAETVALALIALGADGAAKASPAALGPAVAGLGKLGLGADARAVALDAALTRGL